MVLMFSCGRTLMVNLHLVPQPFCVISKVHFGLWPLVGQRVGPLSPFLCQGSICVGPQNERRGKISSRTGPGKAHICLRALRLGLKSWHWRRVEGPWASQGQGLFPLCSPPHLSLLEYFKATCRILRKQGTFFNKVKIFPLGEAHMIFPFSAAAFTGGPSQFTAWSNNLWKLAGLDLCIAL